MNEQSVVIAARNEGYDSGLCFCSRGISRLTEVSN